MRFTHVVSALVLREIHEYVHDFNRAKGSCIVLQAGYTFDAPHPSELEAKLTEALEVDGKYAVVVLN